MRLIIGQSVAGKQIVAKMRMNYRFDEGQCAVQVAIDQQRLMEVDLLLRQLESTITSSSSLHTDESGFTHSIQSTDYGQL
jgi:type II secretory pathway predicted ATPase ExeA